MDIKVHAVGRRAVVWLDVLTLPNNTCGSGEMTKTGFLAAAEGFVRWFGEQAERLQG